MHFDKFNNLSNVKRQLREEVQLNQQDVDFQQAVNDYKQRLKAKLLSYANQTTELTIEQINESIRLVHEYAQSDADFQQYAGQDGLAFLNSYTTPPYIRPLSDDEKAEHARVHQKASGVVAEIFAEQERKKEIAKQNGLPNFKLTRGTEYYFECVSNENVGDVIKKSPQEKKDLLISIFQNLKFTMQRETQLSTDDEFIDFAEKNFTFLGLRNSLDKEEAVNGFLKDFGIEIGELDQNDALKKEVDDWLDNYSKLAMTLDPVMRGKLSVMSNPYYKVANYHDLQTAIVYLKNSSYAEYKENSSKGKDIPYSKHINIEPDEVLDRREQGVFDNFDDVQYSLTFMPVSHELSKICSGVKNDKNQDQKISVDFLEKKGNATKDVFNTFKIINNKFSFDNAIDIVTGEYLSSEQEIVDSFVNGHCVSFMQSDDTFVTLHTDDNAFVRVDKPEDTFVFQSEKNIRNGNYEALKNNEEYRAEVEQVKTMAQDMLNNFKKVDKWTINTTAEFDNLGREITALNNMDFEKASIRDIYQKFTQIAKYANAYIENKNHTTKKWTDKTFKRYNFAKEISQKFTNSERMFYLKQRYEKCEQLDKVGKEIKGFYKELGCTKTNEFVKLNLEKFENTVKHYKEIATICKNGTYYLGADSLAKSTLQQMVKVYDDNGIPKSMLDDFVAGKITRAKIFMNMKIDEQERQMELNNNPQLKSEVEAEEKIQRDKEQQQIKEQDTIKFFKIFNPTNATMEQDEYNRQMQKFDEEQQKFDEQNKATIQANEQKINAMNQTVQTIGNTLTKLYAGEVDDKLEITAMGVKYNHNAKIYNHCLDAIDVYMNKIESSNYDLEQLTNDLVEMKKEIKTRKTEWKKSTLYTKAIKNELSQEEREEFYRQQTEYEKDVESKQLFVDVMSSKGVDYFESTMEDKFLRIRGQFNEKLCDKFIDKFEKLEEDIKGKVDVIERQNQTLSLNKPVAPSSQDVIQLTPEQRSQAYGELFTRYLNGEQIFKSQPALDENKTVEENVKVFAKYLDGLEATLNKSSKRLGCNYTKQQFFNGGGSKFDLDKFVEQTEKAMELENNNSFQKFEENVKVFVNIIDEREDQTKLQKIEEHCSDKTIKNVIRCYNNKCDLFANEEENIRRIDEILQLPGGAKNPEIRQRYEANSAIEKQLLDKYGEEWSELSKIKPDVEQKIKIAEAFMLVDDKIRKIDNGFNFYVMAASLISFEKYKNATDKQKVIKDELESRNKSAHKKMLKDMKEMKDLLQKKCKYIEKHPDEEVGGIKYEPKVEEKIEAKNSIEQKKLDNNLENKNNEIDKQEKVEQNVENNIVKEPLIIEELKEQVQVEDAKGISQNHQTKQLTNNKS